MKKYKFLIYSSLFIVIAIVISIYRIELKKILEQLALWAYPNEENRNGEFIKLVINIIGGVAIIIGLRFALVRAIASQKGVEIQSDSIKNQTYQIELTRNSQVNDQFKNAIEHLGSDKESIVLGGISELHFIANEHSEKFSQVVLNILCSKSRAEANLKKELKTINKTIVQTIINYVFKTETYTQTSTDLSYCNLQEINLDSTKIENCNLSFSIIPWRIKNTEFLNCNLKSIYTNFGRYQRIKFIKSSLSYAHFQSVEFEDTTIYNDKNTPQKMTFLNSKFNEFTFQCNIDNSKFLACEFNSVQFKIKEIFTVNFSCSSFNKSEFETKEIAYCDFSGCGFVETSAKSSIINCHFAGIKNDYRYYSHIMEKQLDQSIANSNNFSGFEYDASLFIHNSISEMTAENKEEIMALNQKVIEDRKKEMEKCIE